MTWILSKCYEFNFWVDTVWLQEQGLATPYESKQCVPPIKGRISHRSEKKSRKNWKLLINTMQYNVNQSDTHTETQKFNPVHNITYMGTTLLKILMIARKYDKKEHKQQWQQQQYKRLWIDYCYCSYISCQPLFNGIFLCHKLWQFLTKSRQ